MAGNKSDWRKPVKDIALVTGAIGGVGTSVGYLATVYQTAVAHVGISLLVAVGIGAFAIVWYWGRSIYNWIAIRHGIMTVVSSLLVPSVVAGATAAGVVLMLETPAKPAAAVVDHPDVLRRSPPGSHGRNAPDTREPVSHPESPLASLAIQAVIMLAVAVFGALIGWLLVVAYRVIRGAVTAPAEPEVS